MKTIYPNSRVEIWGGHYLNYPDTRAYKDKKARVVQIETGSNPGDYIVEVVDDDRED